MSAKIPETMDEVKNLWDELKKEGKDITLDELIKSNVQDLTQAYLDSAEEGHYDSAKLVNDQTIAFVSITGRTIGKYVTKGTSLVDDFKNNSLKLELDLEAAANKVANK
ncbi:hypothetical protein [Fructilactobacillus fructivorans]|uniref:Uncharacterized protein n=1 Tax=Fructilactobacillus fructivorans TaxID=1614 RepID=A0A0C1LYN8_9LACO|nr:hypothetical protein [Fructilactobacillus fructivorans]KID41995.1 hypothetical protein LfDm3_0663 [Fructilactobacillus fructivorans]MCT0151652.1 hypothetical protein [Fructilactobacillus fructivorans]MCT2867219.1 hypothetical protein [Fructilactobacillus fructivorans]MCT2868220.1 hypothetical protein [Fructilactobacillus fructivorans]MCT2872928.1 hypothetical protein [Fructilactobacillus fructivorans]